MLKDLQIASLLRRCKAKLGDNGQFLPNGQSSKSGLNKSLQDAATINFLISRVCCLEVRQENYHA
ncbi:MAG: hypothetical protein F6K40_39025 [Okeania sp. SIO3I5]|uniref:hypothetical protein n=1 Tax=Okeania sp. SIO3I5 TaxID=2607805 RepID=UPI0013B6CD72|nr:hypothetical protein [Okeania sp. SIO3I5]NEQ41856.1 hypothetical protein [Okeania sp. SIO3I5]